MAAFRLPVSPPGVILTCPLATAPSACSESPDSDLTRNSWSASAPMSHARPDLLLRSASRQRVGSTQVRLFLIGAQAAVRSAASRSTRRSASAIICGNCAWNSRVSPRHSSRPGLRTRNRPGRRAPTTARASRRGTPARQSRRKKLLGRRRRNKCSSRIDADFASSVGRLSRTA
jgi:hypothetical protein